jgi:hypothetical protein
MAWTQHKPQIRYEISKRKESSMIRLHSGHCVKWVWEGHGFSRAVKGPSSEGFSL